MKRLCTYSLICLQFVLLHAQSDHFNGLTVKDGLSQGLIYDMLQSKDGYLWIATKDGLNRYDGYNFKVFKNRPDNPHSIENDENKVLYEDSRGYIWIGSNGRYDLNIYDPSTEKFYRTSIENYYTEKDKSTLWPIISIGEDVNGKIWLGTQHGRVIRINTTSDLLSDMVYDQGDQSYKIQGLVDYTYSLPEVIAKDNKGIKDDFVNKFYRSQSGEFFMGTLTRIMKWDEKEQQWILLGEHDHHYDDYDGFKTATEDNEGTVWFANEGQVSLVEVIGTSTKEHKIGSEEDTDLCKVARDSRGNFYISSSLGVFSISAESIKNRTFEKEVLEISDFDGPRSIVVDQTDNVWVRHPTFGIAKFSPFQKKFRTYFKGESVYRIFTDDTADRVLFGKTHFGIWKNRNDFIPLEWEVPHHHSLYFQPEKNIVWTVQREEGNLKDAILVKENYVTGQKWQRAIDEEVLYQHPFLEDGDHLWVALNSGGLGLINQSNLTVQPYFYDDPEAKIRKETQTIYLYQDVAGDIYQCTDDGLIRIRLDNRKRPISYDLFQNDPEDENTLSGNHIMCAVDDPTYPDSILWIGTKGNGANRFNKITGKCKKIGLKDGLPDDVIYGILPDAEGHLWMSTNRGICRYSVATGDIATFTESDGLQSTEFNTGSFAQLPNGELAFGGVNGLNIFDPSDVKLDDFSPPMVISSLKINNQAVAYSTHTFDADSDDDVENLHIRAPLNRLKSIELEHDQNLISIEYAAMDFTEPQKNRYKYILEGHDQDWNEVNDVRLALYSNLPAGHYTFKVKGTNSEGYWSDTAAELGITIHPPWWKSGTAYFMYTLLLAGSILLLYLFQINRIKLKNQLEFEIKEAERLAEMDKLKTNFFSNITHEFRTPLTLIIEPVRQLLKEPLGVQVKDRLKLIKGNSDRLLALVNQLLDISKLEGESMPLHMSLQSMSDIVTQAHQAFIPLADHKGIQLHLELKGDIKDSYIDRLKTEKVLFNLLSNAIKFTEKGHIRIKLNRVSQSVMSISVKDTGMGIAPDQLEKIFDRFYQVQMGNTRMKEGTGIGLALSKELIELMNGTLTVESQPGEGTTFTAMLPIVRQLSSEHIPTEMASIEMVASAVRLENEILITEVETADNETSEKPLLLLVEDNAEVRQFVRILLSDHFKIIEGAHGIEGIAKAKKFVPDIIISDVSMPKKDGIQLTEELKTNQLTSHIPIVLLTAKTDMKSKLKGLKEGADAYITKPFHGEELIVRCQNLIASQSKLKEALRLSDHFVLKADESKISILDQTFIQKVELVIESEINNMDLNVEDLANELHMSRSQLFRKMKGVMGISPSEYIREYRLTKSKSLLMDKAGNITEVAQMVGFGDEKYFSKRFKMKYGVSPSEIR